MCVGVPRAKGASHDPPESQSSVELQGSLMRKHAGGTSLRRWLDTDQSATWKDAQNRARPLSFGLYP